VLRGGSLDNPSNNVRSSNCSTFTPDYTVGIIGFRVARAPL
jgi:formylglycine-generating enzyme required for sulfatase activity